MMDVGFDGRIVGMGGAASNEGGIKVGGVEVLTWMCIGGEAGGGDGNGLDGVEDGASGANVFLQG